MTARVLVAGIGNIFFGDDGFGPQVIARLSAEATPDEAVEIADYGIRSLHLALRLLDPVELLIAIDAMPRGGTPGSLYVVEAEVKDVAVGAADAHGMDLPAVFAAARAMGVVLPRILIVGCEPAGVEEGIGLTAAVQAAIEPAVELVRELVARNISRRGCEEDGDEEGHEDEAPMAAPAGGASPPPRTAPFAPR